MPFALDPHHPMLPVVVWAARALTYFNVMVLLWLGLTVLLNAERRRLGTWLTGGGLLLGGVCSVVRASAQAAQTIEPFAPPDLWWRASWLPFAGAAYLWAVVLAWYTGRLRTRAEVRSLASLSLLGSATFVLLLTARPPDAGQPPPAPIPSSLPSLVPWLAPVLSRPSLPALLGFETVPGDARLALAVYLTFSVLCLGYGLHALYRPGSPDRFMGELASRRARPWLTATSLVTLGLSLVVGLGVTGVLVVTPPVVLDALGAALLAAQVVLLGQAIVSYEVFTGKTLPRRGLARFWRNALILATGFGGLLAVSLGLPLDQSYRLLLALVIVAVFYALQSWRSFVERERSLDQLRPFVASERLVDHLLASEPALSPRAPDPFRALSDGLLGARVVFLCPVGPLASLVGPALAAPSTAVVPSSEMVATLASQTTLTRQLCLPVDPSEYGGATWAVPLWGKRSLTGLLLLGDRRDGSLYSQEEIEIARAAGERLIDARAAGELARRLLLLQRQRLAEDQVLDGRVRRVLHDDVLPLLHTALLALTSGQTGRPLIAGASSTPDDAPAEAADLLADAHRQVAGLLAALPPALAPDVARLGLVGALRRVVDDLGSEIDGVAWRIDSAGEAAAASLAPVAADVLFGAAREALRNAARHARGPRPLQLTIAVALDEDLVIRIEDDGVGLDGGASDEIGRLGGGQGLVLHGTLLTVLGGSLAAESLPERGTRVTLRVPAGA